MAKLTKFQHLLLFFSLFLTYGYFFHRQAHWNVNSRMCLVLAMVEERRFAIDSFHQYTRWETGDKAFYNGHYYSDKAIGLSMLGAGPYALLHVVSRGFGLDPSAETIRYLVRLFSASLLAALAGMLFYKTLLLLSGLWFWSLLLTYATFLATPIFPYATLFYPYGASLFFLLLGLYLILRYRGAETNLPLFILGLTLGWAVVCDYLCALAAGAMLVYLLTRTRPNLRWLRLAAGGAIPLSLFAFYLMVCFGGLTIPYQYEADEVFRTGMRQGLMGIGWPRLSVLYFITLHPYRGVFFYSPFLLLLSFGLLYGLRQPKRRGIASLCLFIVLAYLFVNAGYYMWWGGWAMAARHVIPALPFAALPIIWALEKKALRWCFVFLGLVSLLLIFVPTAVDPQPSQGYPHFYLANADFSTQLRSPMLLLQFPQFFGGELAVNWGSWLGIPGFYSLLPLFLLWVLCAALWRSIFKSKESNC